MSEDEVRDEVARGNTGPDATRCKASAELHD